MLHRFRNLKFKHVLGLYAFLNIVVFIIFIIFWNVTSKLAGYALSNWETWVFFSLICGTIYGLHRWAHRRDGNFSLREAIWSMVGSYLPFFLLYIVFMSSTTGLSDYCIINTYVQKIVNIKEYYTERSVERCTGSGDDRRCHTEYICDVYHPESWDIVAGDGTWISISSGEYSNIYYRFGTPEVQVASRQSGQCSGDGREFHVTWSGTPETRIPCSYEELYINYVRAVELKKEAKESKEYKIAEYPGIESTPYGDIGFPRVIGDQLPPQAWSDQINELLSQELTWLGAKRQCNILFYFTKYPRDFYKTLKDKWLQGKKNDIVIVVGGTVEQQDWVEVWSWSKTPSFETMLRNRLSANDGKFKDPIALVDLLVQHINDPNFGFQRKSMEEYRHLLSQIHLSWWAWLLVFLLTSAIVSPVVIYFLVDDTLDDQNDLTDFVPELPNAEQTNNPIVETPVVEEAETAYTHNPIRGGSEEPLPQDIQQMELPKEQLHIPETPVEQPNNEEKVDSEAPAIEDVQDMGIPFDEELPEDKKDEDKKP